MMVAIFHLYSMIMYDEEFRSKIRTGVEYVAILVLWLYAARIAWNLNLLNINTYLINVMEV